ncbi:transglycosylase SLT domain-containing protein [Candidatus Parcubacteria bacterium]|nr:transglycosylase SLT domain-containing protein [Candidatus Parcubacteria bacterium]
MKFEKPKFNETPYYLQNQKIKKKNNKEKHKLRNAIVVVSSVVASFSLLFKDFSDNEEVDDNAKKSLKEFKTSDNKKHAEIGSDIVKQVEKIKDDLHQYNNNIARGGIIEDEMFGGNWTDEEIENYRKELNKKFEFESSMEISKSIHDILDYNQEGDIVFNFETADQLRNHWKKQYLKYSKTTKKIIERRDKYKDELETVFEEEGVPIEFLNIACTESGFKLATSNKNAGGPYQFLRATGRQYGLTINSKTDERNDAIKSGRACARYLKDLYNTYNDWSLVLARYNGGAFVKRYKKQAEGDLSYPDFLSHRETRINNLRNQLKQNKPATYKVREGNNLWMIAMKYKVSPIDIKKANNLKNDNIVPNQILKIPVLNQKHAEHVFGVEMSDSIENLRYPEKFYGFILASEELEEDSKSKIVTKASNNKKDV